MRIIPSARSAQVEVAFLKMAVSNEIHRFKPNHFSSFVLFGADDPPLA